MNTPPKKIYKVALLGNPNSGKSTVFNELTGMRQRTGNFPGITVDATWAICAPPLASRSN